MLTRGIYRAFARLGKKQKPLIDQDVINLNLNRKPAAKTSKEDIKEKTELIEAKTKKIFEAQNKAHLEKKKEKMRQRQVELDIKKNLFLSPERQINYYLPAERRDSSPANITRQINRAQNIQSLLRIYNQKKFFLDSTQLLRVLGQFSILLPAYKKEKRSIIKLAAKKKVAGGPTLPSFSVDSDSRVLSIMNSLDASIEVLSPREAAFACWVLCKCSYDLDGEKTVNKLLSSVLNNPQRAKQLAFKDLSMLIWGLAKTSNKNQVFIVKIASEIHEMFDLFQDIRATEGVFYTEEEEDQIRELKSNMRKKREMVDPDQQDDIEEDEDQPEKSPEEIYMEASYNASEEGPDYTYDFLPDDENSDAKFGMVRGSVLGEVTPSRPLEKLYLQGFCMYLWSLSKMNITDNKYADFTLELLLSNNIPERLTLVQTQMILKYLTQMEVSDLSKKKELFNRIWAQLEKLLESKPKTHHSKNEEQDLLGNALALKNLLTLMPKAMEISRCEPLFIQLVERYLKRDPRPSSRYITEVCWSIYRAKAYENLPASLENRLNEAVKSAIPKMTMRDISSLVYSIANTQYLPKQKIPSSEEEEINSPVRRGRKSFLSEEVLRGLVDQWGRASSKPKVLDREMNRSMGLYKKALDYLETCRQRERDRQGGRDKK